MHRRRAWPLAAAAVALALAAAPAAEGRELHWRELGVSARLDADGRLHVVERHEMVFTGDWNGGERVFFIRAGQDLDLERLVRVDEGGREIELRKGSLDDVDAYDWAEGYTLRWRARHPHDPPFDGDVLTYRIHYTLSGILVPGGRSDVWTLDHEFAFAERDGVIERLVVDLELDPVWQAPAHWRGHHEVRDLAPGQSWTGTWQLVHTAPGIPAAAPLPTPRWYRQTAAAAAVAAILALLGALFRREAALGRLSRPADLPAEPDRQWMEEHLLSLPAEQAGALWDSEVGTAEVAGLLARLVAEGKLSSEVEPKRGLFGREVLHLRLEVPHDSFRDYERALIDKLFFDGRVETDTETVRQHYRKKRFDAVESIKDGIEGAIKKRIRGRATAPTPKRSRWLLVAAAAAFAVEGIAEGVESLLVFGFAMLCSGLPVYFFATAGALSWRHRVTRVVPAALWWLVPGCLVLAAALTLLFVDDVFGAGTLGLYPGAFGVLGILLVPVAVISSLANLAASRESAAVIRRRHEIVHARRHLARQLRRERPDLDDRWLPHLIALGLGGRVSRWGRRWKGAAADADSRISSLGSSSGSSFGGGGSWTGGGGAFGGAGASAAWATAAAGMASSVSPPSSSSSGGGGGGGSSGGGGGGGW